MISISTTEIIEIMIIEIMKVWYRSLLKVKRIKKNAKMVGAVLIKRLISFSKPNVKFVEYDKDNEGTNINNISIIRNFLEFSVFK